MMKRILSACLISSQLFLLQNVCSQERDALSKQILHHAVDISNIDPASDESSDLAFLKTELDGVDIVLMGEQSHGDGSTFLAKTRIIKYLYENLNFDVLVFESGLFDVHRVWQLIEQGADSIEVFDYGIFPVWATARETIPLFEYILDRATSSRPLYLAGFDMQPTGSRIMPADRWNELHKFLSETIRFDETDYPYFSAAYQNLSAIFQPSFDEKKLEMTFQEFDSILMKLEYENASDENKYFARYIDNYKNTIRLYKRADLKNPSYTPHVFNIRDKEMAENLIFLIEEIYPGKKIMVWGANSHITYGRGLLEPFEDTPPSAPAMIPMGQYLKIDYQDKMYSMAFTSSGGEIGSLRGNISSLPDAHHKSMEAVLAEAGNEVAYVNLRNGAIKELIFPARIYGHAEMQGKWGQMCDGIFFIQWMQPSTLRE